MSSWPSVSEKRGALERVNELAEEARNRLAHPARPLPLRRACQAARVRVTSGKLRIGDRSHIAMLVPFEDGFQATVDAELWERAKQEENARHRLRFVLAHELGHTLFYRPGSPPKRAVPPDQDEERFCHDFANSLLVPPKVAASTPLSPEGLFELAGRFDVSRQVAAWALVRARVGVTILWMTKAPHPKRGGFETMRISWSASSRFIATGESFKSPLAELMPGEHGEAREPLLLAGRQELAHVEAWRFDRAMLAVIRSTEEKATEDRADRPQRLF